MSIYIGIDGIARNVKNIYIGIDGVARKVINGYIGIGGIAKTFFNTFYTYIMQSGTVSSSYGIINSATRKYVDDHWELYIDATISTSDKSYPCFNEIKIKSGSKSLVGKTITVTYKLDSYDSNGVMGYISAMSSSKTWINGVKLSSTIKSTESFTIPSNTDHVVITNHVWKYGNHTNTLYVYSVSIDGEVLI